MGKGFFDYLEDLLPKLVLAPTFVAAVVFIYGFIGWTAWISSTQSELLPEYPLAAGYKISPQVLAKLKDEGVPTAVVEKLQPLVGQDLAKESNFLDAVTEQLGEEETNKYQALLLKDAYTHDLLVQYKKLFASDRWMVALKNLTIFGVSVYRFLYCSGPVVGHLARSTDSRRRIFAHDLSLSHGGIVHRHRRGLAVDFEP